MVGKPDLLDQFRCACGGVCPQIGAQAHGILDIFAHGHIFKQGVILKNNPHFPLIRRKIRNIRPLQENPAAVGTEQSDQDPQKRGLSASGRSQHRQKLPALNRKADMVQRGFAVIRFGQVRNAQYFHKFSNRSFVLISLSPVMSP